MTAFIIIHGLADALAAIEKDPSINLITAPAASAYIGALMFRKIVDRLQAENFTGTIVYDCGANRGDVLAGLRAGLTQFCLDETAMVPALQDILETAGATVIQRPPHCFNSLAEWLAIA